MTAAEMLRDLRARGVILEPDGEALRYRAPEGALTPELREAVKMRRREVLAILQAEAVRSRLRRMNDELSRIFEPVAHPTERGDRAWTWVHGHYGTPIREAEDAVDQAALAGDLQALDAAIAGRCQVWRSAVEKWQEQREW